MKRLFAILVLLVSFGPAFAVNPDEVLDDPGISIMDGLGLGPRTTDTTARLRVALDDVESIVKARRPNRRRATPARRR